MKILILCHKMPYPANDGGAIATMNMIQGFRKAGDDVSVLAMQTHKHSHDVESLPEQISREISWNQIWVNTRINIIEAMINLVFSRLPYNAVRFISKNFQTQLTTLLRQNTYDVIQLEGLYLGPYIDILRKYSNALISLRAHNVEHEIWNRLSQNESMPFKKAYLKILAHRVKRLEYRILDKIDLLVPITARDGYVLNFKDENRIYVSPTGLSESKFKMSKPENEKTLFYLGALDWIPNQEGVLWFLKNVWIYLKEDFPDWRFLVAGRNAPEKFINELKNYPVNYIGEVADADVFIDQNNIMVVPLLSGSGMRIKIIEGMARGKCIVTSGIGAEGIPAKNGHEIFLCDTPSQYLAVLKNLMENKHDYDNCGKNAFIFVRHNYDNTVLIGELRSFYFKHIAS